MQFPLFLLGHNWNCHFEKNKKKYINGYINTSLKMSKYENEVNIKMSKRNSYTY